MVGFLELLVSLVKTTPFPKLRIFLDGLNVETIPIIIHLAVYYKIYKQSQDQYGKGIVYHELITNGGYFVMAHY